MPEAEACRFWNIHASRLVVEKCLVELVVILNRSKSDLKSKESQEIMKQLTLNAS